MNWKEFWSQPAIIFISGTPEEINALRKGKQLEKKGFQEMIEFK